MAGRPPKPVALMTKKMSKEERAKREQAENELKGNSDKLMKIPDWLTKEGRKNYRGIVAELEVTGVLCNLDINALARYSQAIADYRKYDLMKQTVSDVEDLIKIELLQAKAEAKIHKGDISFGLNPSARAKIAQMNQQQKEEKEDPLLKLLAMREG